MNIYKLVTDSLKQATKSLYGQTADEKLIQIQHTRKEFEGDITLVVFPLLKLSKKDPELTGDELGKYFTNNLSWVVKHNVIKGFLNLTVSDSFYLEYLNYCNSQTNYGYREKTDKAETYIIEYSSPNTNKP
jgi:arginyl-tRNA synthetase